MSGYRSKFWCSNKEWVTLSAFQGEGGHPPTTLGVRKLESPWAITRCCLRDPTFSGFDTILRPDSQTIL